MKQDVEQGARLMSEAADIVEQVNGRHLHPQASYTAGLRDLGFMPHVSDEVGRVLFDCADLVDHLATEIEALQRKLRVAEKKVAGAVSDLKRAARRLPGITMALSEQFDELDAALASIRGETD